MALVIGIFTLGAMVMRADEYVPVIKTILLEESGPGVLSQDSEAIVVIKNDTARCATLDMKLLVDGRTVMSTKRLLNRTDSITVDFLSDFAEVYLPSLPLALGSSMNFTWSITMCALARIHEPAITRLICSASMDSRKANITYDSNIVVVQKNFKEDKYIVRFKIKKRNMNLSTLM
jgi:hypothetical protein